MTTLSSTLQYPYDPSGAAATNLITGEQHPLIPNGNAEFYFIVPLLAPYFLNSLKISLKMTDGSTKDLLQGIDWYPTHWYVSASRACAQPVYGSITFFNNQLTGVATLTYQTIGGVWTTDLTTINTILADMLHNPRTTTWEQVVNQPYAFPPVDHQWDLVDMVGASDLVAALGRIETQLRNQGQQGLTDHLNNFNNPHKTNSTQVGLGNVQNYPIANINDATAGTSNELYMTPALVAAAINAIVGVPFANHLKDYGNPHRVSAHQTGTYTSQELDGYFAAKLDAHGVAQNTLQFGSMSPSAFAAWVLQGTANNAMMLGGMTLDQIEAAIQTASLNATLFAGLTYAQTKSDILSGQAADAAKLAGQTPAQLSASILSNKITQASHADNADTVAGVTVDQIITQARAGTAANAAQFGALTPDQWTKNNLSQIQANALTQYAFPASVSTADNTWVKIGTVAFTPTQQMLNTNSDAAWLVMGGESYGGNGVPSDAFGSQFNVRLRTRGLNGSEVSMEVIRLSPHAINMQFGYTVTPVPGSDTLVDVYIKFGPNHTPYSIAELLMGKGFTIDPTKYAELTAEPAGIVYVTPTSVTGSDLVYQAGTFLSSASGMTSLLFPVGFKGNVVSVVGTVQNADNTPYSVQIDMSQATSSSVPCGVTSAVGVSNVFVSKYVNFIAAGYGG